MGVRHVGSTGGTRNDVGGMYARRGRRWHCGHRDGFDRERAVYVGKACFYRICHVMRNNVGVQTRPTGHVRGVAGFWVASKLGKTTKRGVALERRHRPISAASRHIRLARPYPQGAAGMSCCRVGHELNSATVEPRAHVGDRIGAGHGCWGGGEGVGSGEVRGGGHDYLRFRLTGGTSPCQGLARLGLGTVLPRAHEGTHVSVTQ